MKIICPINDFHCIHSTDIIMIVKRQQFVDTQNLMRSKLLAQAFISYALKTEVEVDMSTPLHPPQRLKG